MNRHGHGFYQQHVEALFIKEQQEETLGIGHVGKSNMCLHVIRRHIDEPAAHGHGHGHGHGQGHGHGHEIHQQHTVTRYTSSTRSQSKSQHGRAYNSAA